MTWITGFCCFFMALNVYAEPQVIAHRGASYWAPEESLAAYLLADAIGADYWEMDIQRSKDGVLIALHDLSLKRTTNVAEVFPGREEEPVDAFTWAELQKLDLGEPFNKAHPERARPQFKGLKILSLEQIIERNFASPTKAGLYVESKNPERYKGIEEQMVELFKKKGWFDDKGLAKRPLIWQSFDRDSIAQFRKLTPNVPATLLMDTHEFWNWWKNVNFAVDHSCLLGPDFLALSLPILKWKIASSGVKVHPWTIDAEDDLRKAAEKKVDGVFTNRSDLAVPMYKHTPVANLDEVFQGLEATNH